EPRKRYSSAAELAEDLHRFLNGEPIRARPMGRTERLRRWCSRNPVVASLAAAFVSTLLFGLAGVSWKWLEAKALAERNRYQGHRARLAAAGAALSNHDVADVARQLDEAPEELRDWEWNHLHSRLDDSFGVLQTSADASIFLLGGPEGLRVGTVTA